MNQLKMLKAVSDFNSKVNSVFDGSNRSAEVDDEIEQRPSVQPPAPARSTRVLFEAPVHAWKPRIGTDNWQVRYAIIEPNSQLTITRGPEGNLSDTVKLKGLPRESFRVADDIRNLPNYLQYFRDGGNYDLKQSVIISDPYHNKIYPICFHSRVDFYKFVHALKKCGAYSAQAISTEDEVQKASKQTPKKVASARERSPEAGRGNSGGLLGMFCCGSRSNS